MEKLPSPEEYAQSLIDSFITLNQGVITSKINAITCAENTIKFCADSTGLGKHFELTPEFDYLNSVLTILKDKL